MGMDSVEILMKVEKAFGIEITQEEVDQIITVGDLHDAVWKQLNTVKGTETTKTQMESTINQIIAEISGVDLEEVTRNKKICDDLGID
jgi:acyl carrier protein